MIQKQCISCDADSGNKSKCKTCLEAHNSRNRLRRQTRKSAGLCSDCGNKSQSGRTLCDKCHERNYVGRKHREKIRNLAGECANCEKPKNTKRRLCEDCIANVRDYSAKRIEKLLSLGLCTSCGKEPHMPKLKDSGRITMLCQRCHLEKRSSQRLGSTKHWESLLLILEQQNWTCPYSGDKIVLGVNDSVDHILPTSKYPKKKFDTTNIQWTTRVINLMKSDLLDCEFLSEIERVAKHLGNNLSCRAASKTHPPQTRESKLYHRMCQPKV